MLYYIVSEYCPGGSLADLIKKGSQLSLLFIINCFADLLKGLIEIHSRNILHCNIKLENILFNSLGKPLLADIGFYYTKKKNILIEESLER